MNNHTHEPQPPAPQPRPCSTPHSAPLGWLEARTEPPPEAPPEAPREAPPETPDPETLRAAIELILASPAAVAEIIARAPAAAFEHPAHGGVRHDGWTGERMATFLEILADTGLVTEGCRAAGMSRDSAYSLRTRDPVFAAAWRAAQAKARPQVADGILERSITGTVEHYYRDGVLVGERRHYESWLALAVLKRLDQQAADDRAEGTLAARMAGDWQATLDALRDGGSGAVTSLLAPETDKADTPPSPPGFDPHNHCWIGDDGEWRTDFPPPPGFDGHENRPWDGINNYERACSAEEVAIIHAHEAAERAAQRAEEEAMRDAWFRSLEQQRAGAQPQPGPG